MSESPTPVRRPGGPKGALRVKPQVIRLADKHERWCAGHQLNGTFDETECDCGFEG